MVSNMTVLKSKEFFIAKLATYSPKIFYRLWKMQNIKKIQNNIFNNINIINNVKFSTKDLVQIAASYKPKNVESKQLPEVSSPLPNIKGYNKQFTILLPPPNVTGQLHLGHALMCTIQDVICRWKYFHENCNILWIPGTDHAGIATQVVVEKKLWHECKQTRHDVGRDVFLQMVQNFRNDNGYQIKRDLLLLGSCMNWDREYFTMDQVQSNAVTNAFIKLYEAGLIYRDNTLINWSCSLESAISDIEIENLEINGPTEIVIPGYDRPVSFGKLYNIAYKICDSETNSMYNDEIIISTTRPETLLGDMAIAVNPNDERYSHLHNNNTTYLWHPFRNEKIPLIFDDGVSINFGNGAVKITPAHDKFDFELAKRHHLISKEKKTINVIDEKGLICSNLLSKYAGLKRFIARETLLNDLANLQLLRDIKQHSMVLPVCSRSKDTIEYLLKFQWFLKCSELSRQAIDLVDNNIIKIFPEHFKQEWNRWLIDCKDWCISRQLWWGHRIPIYQCILSDYQGNQDQSIWIAARSKENALEKLQDNNKNIMIDNIKINQDTDVLDTWFSSGILPFSIFNLSNDVMTAESFKEFQDPLNLMVTGHDILFFWVARMVMLSMAITGKIPFHEILLHGIICDSNGRKMSKSLGNIITPQQIINGISLKDLSEDLRKSSDSGLITLEEFNKSVNSQNSLFPNGIPECGTDALRFTLCSYNLKNHFINFDINECSTNKLFFNKIWQATRFTLMAMKNQRLTTDDVNVYANKLCKSSMTEMDQWILSRLGQTIKIINQSMIEYNLHIITSALRTLFYSNLCDVYLETTKNYVSRGPNSAGKMHCIILNLCLTHGLNYMKILTPFLCNELLQHLPQCETFQADKWINIEIEKEIEQIIEVSSAVRKLKSKNKISWKYKPIVHIYTEDQDSLLLFERHANNIKALTQAFDVKLYSDLTRMHNENLLVKSTATHLCTFGISAEHMNNLDTSTIHIKQISYTINNEKLVKLRTDLEKLIKTISNAGYRTSAKQEIQKKHLERIKHLKMEIERIQKLQ